MPVTTATTTRERVLEILPVDAAGVVLESPSVVSWYLGGARTSVPLGGASVVAVLVTRHHDEVRCHVMEADRLVAEEGIAEPVRVAWTESLVPDVWRSDPRILAEHRLEAELRQARASLTPLEVDRYRALGADVARAVTSVAASLHPADTEHTAAGHLADSLYALGAEPVVLLAAGAERLGHRHPLPTAARLGERAMLVVGARRHGLIVNLTRWVSFDASTSTADAERRLRAVETDVLDATVPGVELAAVFETLRVAYQAHGFGADEWRRHHQGGPTGYLGRDPKVTPNTTGTVAEHQAFAWNPSAPGVKVEDTVLATSAGIELLSHDPAWPSTEVAGRQRPLTLQL
jgi:Xaa-Pro aminopeptidase